MFLNARVIKNGIMKLSSGLLFVGLKNSMQAPISWSKVCDGLDPNRKSHGNTNLGAASDLANC